MILMALFILLSFNGCTTTGEKIVYVQKCPKLQTYEVKKMDKITYEVVK